MYLYMEENSMYIFLIILFLIFVPFPVKIFVSLKNNALSIFIYKFRVYNSKKIKKTIKNKSDNLNPDLFKKSINSLKSIKFKPILNFHMYLCYGFDEADKTAIFYGVLCNIYTIIQRFLQMIFNINKINFDTKLNFNKNIINLNINSIIFISFANIIYIAFVLFKNIHPYINANK